MTEKDIQTKIQSLPDALKKEVMDFVEFLLSKTGDMGNGREKFMFDWEGGLSDINEKASSVELQHKASGWR